jgi:hypothetical protein
LLNRLEKAQPAAGNTFTSLYAGVFGGSASDAATAVIPQTPDLLNSALGAPLTYGRRTADILALNLAGKGGLPQALSSASRGVRSFLGSASKAFNLGLDATEKGAIDVGLSGLTTILQARKAKADGLKQV